MRRSRRVRAGAAPAPSRSSPGLDPGLAHGPVSRGGRPLCASGGGCERLRTSIGASNRSSGQANHLPQWAASCPDTSFPAPMPQPVSERRHGRGLERRIAPRSPTGALPPHRHRGEDTEAATDGISWVICSPGRAIDVVYTPPGFGSPQALRAEQTGAWNTCAASSTALPTKSTTVADASSTPGASQLTCTLEREEPLFRGGG